MRRVWAPAGPWGVARRGTAPRRRGGGPGGSRDGAARPGLRRRRGKPWRALVWVSLLLLASAVSLSGPAGLAHTWAEGLGRWWRAAWQEVKTEGSQLVPAMRSRWRESGDLPRYFLGQGLPTIGQAVDAGGGIPPWEQEARSLLTWAAPYDLDDPRTVLAQHLPGGAGPQGAVPTGPAPEPLPAVQPPPATHRPSPAEPGTGGGPVASPGPAPLPGAASQASRPPGASPSTQASPGGSSAGGHTDPGAGDTARPVPAPGGPGAGGPGASGHGQGGPEPVEPPPVPPPPVQRPPGDGALAAAGGAGDGWLPGDGAVPENPWMVAVRRSVDWGEGPLVAILHSHTSEMYRTDDFAPPHPDGYHRFGAADTGIVRVGEVLAARLQGYGIGVVHSRRIHDAPVHALAYRRSRETVQQLLERYPTLQLVLDVHRDSPQGRTAVVAGRTVGQVMLLVGTGENTRGLSNPHWRQNLALARELEAVMEQRFPGLFRRTWVRQDARFNQDLHPGMLLVEIGSYDTHLDEATEAARMLGDAIAEMLWRRRASEGRLGEQAAAGPPPAAAR